MKYFVEYSPEQGCFHIESVDIAIEKGLRRCIEGRSSQYEVVSVKETHEDAEKSVEYLRKIFSAVRKT